MCVSHFCWDSVFSAFHHTYTLHTAHSHYHHWAGATIEVLGPLGRGIFSQILLAITAIFTVGREWQEQRRATNRVVVGVERVGNASVDEGGGVPVQGAGEAKGREEEASHVS